MAVDERSRRSLYDLLKEPLGMDATNALLDELPPLGAELATKDDIARLREATKADIARLREATKADIARLEAASKTDITRLETNIAGVEQRLRDEMGRQTAELGRQIAEVKAHLSAQNAWMILGMLGLIVALVISLVTIR